MDLTQALIDATVRGEIKWSRKQPRMGDTYWSGHFNGVVVNVHRGKIQVTDTTPNDMSTFDYDGSKTLLSVIEDWYASKDRRKKHSVEQVIADALGYKYDGKGEFR